MNPPGVSKQLERTFRAAVDDARSRRHEYLTQEHLLLAVARDRKGAEILRGCGADPARLAKDLDRFLGEEVEPLPEGEDRMPQETLAIRRLLAVAAMQAEASEQETLDVGNVLVALFRRS